MAILQTGVHFMVFCLVLWASSRDPQGEKVRTAAVAFVFFGIALCKDALVLRGVFAMRKGQGWGWALTGAIAGCLPDVAWVIALIPAIWCLVVLNNRHVRQAFNGYRYYDEEDEDDF